MSSFDQASSEISRTLSSSKTTQLANELNKIYQEKDKGKVNTINLILFSIHLIVCLSRCILLIIIYENTMTNAKKSNPNLVYLISIALSIESDDNTCCISIDSLTSEINNISISGGSVPEVKHPNQIIKHQYESSQTL